MKSARNAGLLAVCCVLVHDAFGDSSINSGGGGAQLALRYGDILGESFAKLLDSSFRTGFHHAVPQGLFLNAAAKAETSFSPRDLLKEIHRIEAILGRERSVKNGPRTIDIDILLYDDLQLNEPDLVIPHPRMHERDFVMRPLKEIR